MSDTEATGTLTPSGDGRERGSRRRRIYGYLKAANEIRQSYSSQLTQDAGADDQDMPGAFAETEVFRSGNEEMILFPSYARKHLRQDPVIHHDKPGALDDAERAQGVGDADYWKREWARFEDENAIVDVDVRGWIYSPSRTPLNRKNRLILAVARKLSGIPVPTASPDHSRASSRHSKHRAKLEEKTTKHEEEIAAKEAQSLVQRGEGEADAAWKGNYSLGLAENSNRPSPLSSRSPSPVRPQKSHGEDRPKSLDEFSLVSNGDEHSLEHRPSWGQPSSMSKEELAMAHRHLMHRLKPFMSMPLTGIPITIFFFNDEKSQSKTVNTNDSGHFNVRASLDFVPTHIRVLASEHLSAMEPVHITEEKGISLISDIDDTIKHSAIASGAKEIFKNTFIRELRELTVQGVKEWYTKLYSMGVKLHYVSNSPWQLYPLLQSYFSLAGLPPGSFHLKQYSGMLQGIFEPAAERKRGSLERIMGDFPERRFILVGDSGEADLEVYTDVVMANPGRVLAVYIRDVTTAPKKQFFDQAVSNARPDSRIPSDASRDRSSHASAGDDPEKRPPLPDRRNAVFQSSHEFTSTQGTLIDFEDEPEDTSRDTSYTADLLELHDGDTIKHKSPPPAKPAKPAKLRSTSRESRPPSNHDRIATTDNPAVSPALAGESPKPPPPKPRRPSSAVQLPSVLAHSQSQHAPFSSARQHQEPPVHAELDIGDHSSSSSAVPNSSVRPGLGAARQTAKSTKSNHSSHEEDGYALSALRQLTSAYNALPSIRSSSPIRDNGLNSKSRNPSDPSTRVDMIHPPLPPRRGLTSYPVAAAQWVTGTASGSSVGDHGASGGGVQPINKKEEVWKRRWARAEGIMKREGVVLKSWRVGTDVMDDCVAIVEGNFRELKHEEGGMGGKHQPRQKETRLRRV